MALDRVKSISGTLGSERVKYSSPVDLHRRVHVEEENCIKREMLLGSGLSVVRVQFCLWCAIIII